MSRRVQGCRRKVRVLLVIFDCVGGVLLVEVDWGCGWKTLRRVLSRVSWCLIANVVEGVAYLVVFDRGFRWEVLCWEVAWPSELGCCC